MQVQMQRCQLTGDPNHLDNLEASEPLRVWGLYNTTIDVRVMRCWASSAVLWVMVGANKALEEDLG
jgi:hypothetical protein